MKILDWIAYPAYFMGVTLCRNIEQKAKTTVKCCSKCSREQLEGVPFISYENCSHLLCPKCTQGNEFSCPLETIRETLLDKGRKMYESILPYDNSIFRQNCRKKHAMIWKPEYKICRKCLQACHGFQCRICSEYLCTFCSKTYRFASKKQCPNRHRTQWEHKGVDCLICNIPSHGWVCIQCGFAYCSGCSEVPLVPQKCPNDHTTEWSAAHRKCIQCKVQTHGMGCKMCNFYFCSQCSKVKFQQSKCPNNHTTVPGRGTCIRCDLTTHVMKCQKCEYSCCTKCELQKYSTNKMSTKSTERDYQTRTAPVTFQNKLFQKAQQLRKTSEEAGEGSKSTIKEQNSSEEVSKLKVEARSMLMEQKYKQAVEIYSQILKLEPKSIDVLVDMGEAYEFLKENAKALECYNKVQEIERKCLKGIKKAVSLILASSQDHTVNSLNDIEAETLIMYCNKIVELEPANLQYKLLRAQLYIRSKKFSSAVDLICQSILNDDTEHIEALLESVSQALQSLEKLNLHEQSIQILEKLIPLCEQHPDQLQKFALGHWYKQMGFALNKSGKESQAKVYFNKISKSDPEYLNVKEFLSE